MASNVPPDLRNQQRSVQAPLKQQLYGCYIDIPNDSKHSAEYWRSIMKEELTKSDDLKDYDKNTFNIRSIEENKYRCHINFNNVEKVKKAVELFDKEVNGFLLVANENCPYTCCIDIPYDSNNSAEYWGDIIKDKLNKSDVLKHYNEKKFNIKYKEKYKQFECFINFYTVGEVTEAVKLFDGKKVAGATFKSKRLKDTKAPKQPPDGWIDCENQAVKLIDGKYSRMDNF